MINIERKYMSEQNNAWKPRQGIVIRVVQFFVGCKEGNV
jgi:hypothetical protein